MIIPAILATNKADFLALLESARSYTDYIQIDFMDGQFVSSRSVLPREIFYENYDGLSFEAHLMVTKDRLEEFINGLKNFEACKRIYIHREISEDEVEIRTFLNMIIDTGKEAGLVLNPGTAVDEVVMHLRHKLSAYMVMGVEPGHYGSEFQESSLDLLRELKEKMPEFEGDFAWDGAANEETIPSIFAAGANRVAVGSAIAKADKPQEAYTKLSNLK